MPALQGKHEFDHYSVIHLFSNCDFNLDACLKYNQAEALS